MLAAGSSLQGSASPALIRKFTTPVSGGPPPPPPSGSGGTPPPPPLGTPNLTNLVGQDPAYLQAQADEQAAIDAARSLRDSSTNRALIQFGAVPDFASIGASLGLNPDQIAAITGGISNSTKGLADQYTKSGDSVLAQLNHAHDVALDQLRAQLAARGMLESGSTGVGVGMENQNLQHGLSQAYQQLLGSLLGYQTDFANAQRGAEGQLENAASSAYDRAVQLAQQIPGYGTPPPPPPGAPPAAPHLTTPLNPTPTNFFTDTSLSHQAVPVRHRSPLPNAYVTGRKRFG